MLKTKITTKPWVDCSESKITILLTSVDQINQKLSCYAENKTAFHSPDVGKQATRIHGLSMGAGSRSSMMAMSLSNVLSRKSGCRSILATWCTVLRPVSTFRSCSPMVTVSSLGLKLNVKANNSDRIVIVPKRIPRKP